MNQEETIELPCLNCGTLKRVGINSNEANGIFNVFCDGGDCEDHYAWRQ